MKKKLISVTLLMILLTTAFSVLPGTFGASEEDIEASIELGISYLASVQNPDGSWGNGYLVSKTGLAVLKLIDYVKEVPGIDSWTDPDYVYHSNVSAGLDFLFREGYYVDISVQTYGDPDTLDNDKGITFNGFDDYEVSIALMALGATMTPGLTVTTTGPLNGVTYADIVQDVVDYLSYTQRESTYARGGWGYEGQADWADNSVSGYAALGLGYAQAFGATIPQFVKDELAHWIGIIQSPAGYSYYRPPDVWSDPYEDHLLRTGNLLYEMALVGMPVDDPSVQAAITYIENNWAIGANYYQRAYCLMKGLEAYGIDDEITVGTSGDWFDELSTFIVSNQNPDGSWPNDDHDWDGPEYPMTAAWALLTLEKAVAIPQKTPLGMKEDAREILVSHLGLYDKHIEHDIEQAIWHIDKSMNPGLWVDDSHLVWQHGNKVFDEEKLAVKELLHIVEWKNAPSDAIDMAFEVIEILVEADEKLATIEYDEALPYAGTHKQVDHQLELALEEFANAADELATDKKGHPKYDDAINAYNKAWQHAGLAIQHATK